MNTNLQNYYTQRLGDYETIYQNPERQPELIAIAAHLQQAMKDKNVLEIACGTGYWTERYAAAANSVQATDASEEMLATLQAKAFPAKARVRCLKADAFALPDGDFNACVAGFWWSHMKRSEQAVFLEGLQQKCGSGTVFVMFDNTYVEGESTPIARTDAEGNTYQIRRLPDGSRHEIIKNFPADSALRKKLSSYVRDIRITRGAYYWTLTCILR